MWRLSLPETELFLLPFQNLIPSTFPHTPKHYHMEYNSHIHNCVIYNYPKKLTIVAFVTPTLRITKVKHINGRIIPIKSEQIKE